MATMKDIAGLVGVSLTTVSNVVQLTNSCVPTVVTIVNRKRLCRRRYCCG